MRYLALGLAIALSGFGCNSLQLERTTLHQSRTIPDLQQKQVMENFARLTADAGSLPYFDLVSVGTSAVTDRGTASLSLGSVVREFTKADYGGEAEREISGNWTISPTNDPNRLAAMRAAYMIAMGRDAEIAPIDLQRLDDFLILNYDVYKATRDPHLVIPSGWLCVGEKSDCPKGCPYFAHKNGVYVWVKDGRLQDLANFSLIILDIATLKPTGPARGTAEKPAAETSGAAASVGKAGDLRKDTQAKKEWLESEKAQITSDLREARANMVPELMDAKSARLKQVESELTTVTNQYNEAVAAETRLLNEIAADSAQQRAIQAENARQQQESSAIPDRLNGPVFNQGLFLIPR